MATTPGDRRSRAPRPRPGSGPGRTPSARGGRPVAAPSTAVPAEQPRRSRFTGRAAVLVLVVAVLTVSYASSMRAYLQQRAHISELKAQIAEREQDIDALEREKRRWDDPAYVQAQARERFGYLLPGETSYVVLDEDGNPLDTTNQLPDASEVGDQTPEAWWGPAWDSVVLAGDPPAAKPPPATDLKAPAEEIGE